jgi:hypothetical protein
MWRAENLPILGGFAFVRASTAASALSGQRPRTVLNAGSMHSIVYMDILTRMVWRGFDCSKMTAVVLFRAPRVKRSQSSDWKWSEFFLRHQAWPEISLVRRCFCQSQLL